MSSEVLDFFERSIRPVEESSGPTPEIQIDRLLRFTNADGDRVFAALRERLPLEHWASDGRNFQSITEGAIQLLSVGLCRLRDGPRDDGHPLECCARVVHAPTLSPYVRKAKFNYVVMPVGFISAIQKFVFSTYSMATIAACQKDPKRETILWDHDFFLGAITLLAETDVFTFTRGVMEASLESSMQKVVENFSDILTFSAFNRDLQDAMLEMMPAKSSWGQFGFDTLDSVLDKNSDVRLHATKIARLAVCFTVCHEFSHVFTLSIDAEGAKELATDEVFADLSGALIFYRLTESGILPLIVGSSVTERDLGNALAAFHCWNLSKELGRLAWKDPANMSASAIDRLHEVAVRWTKAMGVIQQIWTDDVPAMKNSADNISVGRMMVNHWGF